LVMKDMQFLRILIGDFTSREREGKFQISRYL